MNRDIDGEELLHHTKVDLPAMEYARRTACPECPDPRTRSANALKLLYYNLS